MPSWYDRRKYGFVRPAFIFNYLSTNTKRTFSDVLTSQFLQNVFYLNFGFNQNMYFLQSSLAGGTGATPFSTPITTCSGAPPRQPFSNAQYGPPPVAAILPAGGATPSSHGHSPTPSSGSGGGGGFANQPPGYPRSKFGRMRGNPRQNLATPPTSPAKNRGGKGTNFCNPLLLMWSCCTMCDILKVFYSSGLGIDNGRTTSVVEIFYKLSTDIFKMHLENHVHSLLRHIYF